MPRVLRPALLATSLLLAAAAGAASPDPRELMRKSDAQHRLAKEKTRATMTLQESGGPLRTRTVESLTVQDEAKGDRLRVVFLAPADVNGTTLLSSQGKNGQGDEQWLYLPAFKKTRRVGESELGDRFVGTDFFFEDMKPRQIDDYDYQLLGSEKIDGADCFVIESVPSAPKVKQESPYGKTQLWLRQDNLVVVKARFFDRQLKPLKELESLKLRQVQGNAWRADETRVTDLKRKHRTVVMVEQRDTQVAVTAETFNPQMLGR